MKLKLILLGVVFLFEPYIGIIDILPDFLGYIFILAGISKISDIDVKMSLSRAKLTSALYVAIGRFVCGYLSLILKFDSTLILVFSFTLAVLEIMFALSAFTSFFESLEYMQLRRADGVKVVGSDNVKKMTVLFIFVKSIVAVIPEFTSLVNEYGDVLSGGGANMNMGVIRLMLLVIAVITSFVFGAVWLSIVRKYLRAVISDKAFVLYLEERYENEVSHDSLLFIKRSVKRFSRLCFAALFFLIFIPFDSYYIFPEFFFGIMLLIAFSLSGGFAEGKKKLRALTLLFSALSLVSYIFLFRYSSRLGDDLFPYENAVFASYFLPYIIPAVLSFVLMLFIFRAKTGVMRRMSEKCVGLGDAEDARRDEINAARRSDMIKAQKRLFAAECVYTAASIVFTVLTPYLETAWIFRTASLAVVAVMSYSVCADLSAEAEKML